MTLRGLLRLAVSLAVLVAAACGTSPTSPTTTLKITDLRVGDGATAASGNTVTVHYTGWIYDPTKANFKGLQFDTSLGGDPFVFTLGSGSVIKGWDQGIVGMQVNGLRQLIIPSSLAYGSTRYNSIPPYATLLFEINLLDVQ